jgi:hypothetical protein
MAASPGNRSDRVGIRFLARLAPGIPADVPRVRAALPSRFAPADALEPLPGQGPPRRPEHPDEDPTRPGPSGVRAAMPQVSHPSAEVPIDGPGVHVAPRPATEPRSTGMPRSIVAQEAPGPEPVPRGIGIAATPRGPRTGDIEAQDSIPTPMQAPITRDRGPSAGILAAPGPVDDRLHHDLPTDASRRAPGPAPADPGPLSELAAALGRAAAARDRDRPTVVHVTIDRIDLHAPAAPAPGPHPRARVRSTMSLGEYLRRRAHPGSRGETP